MSHIQHQPQAHGAGRKAALHFDVEGMKCASCVSRAQKAIKGVNGVSEALVNLVERSAVVKGQARPHEVVAALEKAGFSARLHQAQQPGHHHATGHVRQLWLRAVVAGVLSLPLMADMFYHFMPHVAPTAQGNILWFVVAAVCAVGMVFSGGAIYRDGLCGFAHFAPNMNSLVGLGTFVAWGYSVALVAAPQVWHGLATHTYFEATLMILCLVNVGGALEAGARGKASEAVKKLLELAPQHAWRVRDGREEKVPLADIKPGDMLRIKPANPIPLDGVVVKGEAYVDESMLTGEPYPVRKTKGSTVTGGTLIRQGTLLVRTAHVGEDTVLAQIVARVREAQATKPPIGRLADVAAGYFTYFVILLAAATATMWWQVGPQPHLSYAIVTAMTVLVVACPCALGLATPVAVVIAVGRAAGQGFLIRDGEALQRIGKVTTLVLDKTGTLTEGKPAVTDIACVGTAQPELLLTLAASVEQGSDHPIGAAIMAAAATRALTLQDVTKLKVTSGMGVKAHVGGQAVVVGSRDFLKKEGVDTKPVSAQAERFTKAGHSLAFVAVDGKAAGLIVVADTLRKDAADALKSLKAMGLKLVLLTGDNAKSATAVSQGLGFDETYADMNPEGKLKVIRKLQARGETVAMVGDGINDAPALAAADVGIAMGTGAHAAIESAAATLMGSSLAPLPKMMKLSRVTLRIIYQNLVAAFGYNIIALPLAAGALYPLTGTLISPVVAGAAMAFSSVTVVANANRLRRLKLK